MYQSFNVNLYFLSSTNEINRVYISFIIIINNRLEYYLNNIIWKHDPPNTLFPHRFFLRFIKRKILDDELESSEIIARFLYPATKFMIQTILFLLTRIQFLLNFNIGKIHILQDGQFLGNYIVRISIF